MKAVPGALLPQSSVPPPPTPAPEVPPLALPGPSSSFLPSGPRHPRPLHVRRDLVTGVLLNMPFASLPSLRDLRVGFHTQRDSFFISAVVHSASSLRSLTITHPPTNLPHIFPLDFPVLASISPTLIHLTCEPGPGRLNALRHVVPSEEDDYLPLLSTMNNLKTPSIILLPTPAFFAALRTLPRLVSLRVFVTAPIAASEVSRSLADLSFRNLELTMANVAAWDKGRVGMVGAAADAAGISFRYEVSRG